MRAGNLARTGETGWGDSPNGQKRGATRRISVAHPPQGRVPHVKSAGERLEQRRKVSCLDTFLLTVGEQRLVASPLGRTDFAVVRRVPESVGSGCEDR